MISATEFETLVEELILMEVELKRLGDIKVMTSEGPHAMREQGLMASVPEQKAYNDLFSQYARKKRIVEAFDMVARYKIAQNIPN